MTNSISKQLFTIYLIALIVILVQVFAAGPRRPVADEYVYIGIARDIANDGTFSDGIFADKNQSGIIQPGRFFAPVYPTFLASLTLISQEQEKFIECHAREGRKNGKKCPDIPVVLKFGQSVFAAIGLTGVFAMALMLSNSIAVAGGALIISLLAGKSAYYAGTALSENAAFFGFYLFLALGVAGLVKLKIRYFALAGIAIGLAILSRPSYLYLFYAMIISLLVLAGIKRLQINWKHALAFTITGGAVLSPWIFRNMAQFGDPALTAGYSGYILVQRVSYNAMSWSEWLVSFVYWLPDFGDNLAKSLFPNELFVRLGYDDPSSYYLIGNRDLKRETLLAAGGRTEHLVYLLREYVFGDLFKHVMVTIPLTLRGIWVGKYLAIAGMILIIPVGRLMVRSGMLLPFAFIMFSLFFMAGLHGFTSVNVVRYNIPMVALYSYVVVYVIFVFASKRGWLPERIKLTAL